MGSDIDARTQREVLRRILPALGSGTGLMLMGNSASLRYGVPHVTRTKDVDVSILLADERRRVAPVRAIRSALDALGIEPATAPEDGSWIKAYVEVDEARHQVDFIRGKSRDRPGGTFIDRRTLNGIVAAAAHRGDVFLPGPTDLVLMKAWAATDQARHMEHRPADRVWHRDRLRAYRGDVRRLTGYALDHGLLAPERLLEMLDRMADHRRGQVRAELVRAGSLGPDEGEPGAG